MKNQYFGDIGDYGKYGLLRFLAENGISISVNWYLNPTGDDVGEAGKFTKYLLKENEKAFRKYDPIVYDTLKERIEPKERRNVLVMNETDLIPRARYYTEPLPAMDGVSLSEWKQRRDEWHKNALSFCAGSDLVFLDPDNGIQPEDAPSLRQKNKYVFLEEALEYYNDKNLNVVYYCHKGRRPPEEWNEYKQILKKELPTADFVCLTYHRGTQRSYIFALHSDRSAEIRQLLDAFLASDWGTPDKKNPRKNPMFTSELV